MKTFQEFLNEKNINNIKQPLKPEHHAEIHAMLTKVYSNIGGYGSLGSGSYEEAKAIHADILNPKHSVKAVTRPDENGKSKVVAVVLYKHNKDTDDRKIIGLGTDNTPNGKNGLTSIMDDDVKLKRSWGEFSKAAEAVARKRKFPEVDVNKVPLLLPGKEITPTEGNYYKRKLGGVDHTKVVLGYPKQ